MYLEDFDNITDASLGSYVVEGLIPMLTQSRVDLQYLEERGYDIRSIVERGEKRSEQKILFLNISLSKNFLLLRMTINGEIYFL